MYILSQTGQTALGIARENGYFDVMKQLEGCTTVPVSELEKEKRIMLL